VEEVMKSRKLTKLNGERLEERVAPWTTPVLREPVPREILVEPTISSAPGGGGNLPTDNPEMPDPRRVVDRQV